jgi:hypothetical protein
MRGLKALKGCMIMPYLLGLANFPATSGMVFSSAIWSEAVPGLKGKPGRAWAGNPPISLISNILFPSLSV